MNRAADLIAFFESRANPGKAQAMESYMRGQFRFLGIQSVRRKELARSFFREQGFPHKEDLEEFIVFLWNAPWREMHYVAQELTARYKKGFQPDDIQLFRFMINNHSWWDTVDFIAANLVGSFCQKFPECASRMEGEWAESDNIWERRTAILYQLKYKSQTDSGRLAAIIEKNLNSTEFFINKAIGWALREYSKTNAVWVKHTVSTMALHPLSRREALKWLNRTELKEE